MWENHHLKKEVSNRKKGVREIKEDICRGSGGVCVGDRTVKVKRNKFSAGMPSSHRHPPRWHNNSVTTPLLSQNRTFTGFLREAGCPKKNSTLRSV